MRGTIKELEAAGGVYVNGHKLSASEVSVLAKVGILPVVGKQPNAAGKGKPANVLEVIEGHMYVTVTVGESE